MRRAIVSAVVVGMALAAASIPQYARSSQGGEGNVAEGNGKVPSDAAQESEDGSAETSPFSANAGCYVCHIPFVKEELAKVHLKAKITCVRCHGPSAGHANDENIGRTKPDIVFRPEGVDPMCRECHKKHDVPARQVVARFVQRGLTTTSPVCTDCHGNHKIAVSNNRAKPQASRRRAFGHVQLARDGDRGSSSQTQ